MKLSQKLFLLLLILTSANLYSQDTISIYFDFGQSKIPNSQISILSSIPIKYDISDLDSISYIGMADSVGDFNSNLKLSQKRAQNVAEQCRHIFNGNIPYSISALGEKTINVIDRNRRVDVILHFQSNNKEEPENSEQTESINKKNVCYNIDYKLLHRCHIRTITKRKMTFVIIETTKLDQSKKKDYYYGSITESGEFVTNKIKWIPRATGKFWWAETRLVATIPKKDFDAFRIFSIEDLPCDICNEKFQLQTKTVNEDTCRQVDRFLMENIQIKTNFFNNYYVNIRVPKEYVNIEDPYFVACDYKTKLIWNSKGGKRNQNYYYSKLPIIFNHVENIVRVMDCCKFKPEPSECAKKIINCQTFGEIDKSFVFNADIGSLFQQSTVIPYAGLGISKEGDFSRIRMEAGTDKNFSFFGSISYQHHFLSFPYSIFKSSLSWQKPSNQNVIFRYARFYLGSELKTIIKKEKQNCLEQNIHIGLTAVDTRQQSFLPRFFIQYGLGVDYLDKSSTKVYSIGQLGIIIKIFRF